MKQRDDLSPLLMSIVLQYATRRVQVILDCLKLNCTHQLWVYTDDINMFGGSVHTTKENAENWHWLVRRVDWK
jgi:hypothetical protein